MYKSASAASVGPAPGPERRAFQVSSAPKRPCILIMVHSRSGPGGRNDRVAPLFHTQESREWMIHFDRHFLEPFAMSVSAT